VGRGARRRFGSCRVNRLWARRGNRLTRERFGSRGGARGSVDQARATLTRSVDWLVGRDGPMGPSPRVMYSICVCVYIYIYHELTFYCYCADPPNLSIGSHAHHCVQTNQMRPTHQEIRIEPICKPSKLGFMPQNIFHSTAAGGLIRLCSPISPTAS
jgi:hypothetical protein